MSDIPSVLTSHPLLSVSIICVNPKNERTLRRQIDSVITASSRVAGGLTFEHLVLGTKLSSSIKTVLREAPHVIWSEEDSLSNIPPHLSEPTLMELGVERASGEFLLSLKDGDALHEEGLVNFLSHIGKNDFLISQCLLTEESQHNEAPGGDKLRNSKRSWYDALKYWVQGSTPLLSGLLIRKTFLLELIHKTRERSLWNFSHESVQCYRLFLELLRLIEPTTKQSPSTNIRGSFAPFSLFYRNESAERRQTNSETSASQPFFEKENALHTISRHYRSSINSIRPFERCISVVIRTAGVSKALEMTLQSCSRQSFQDFEIITVASSENSENALEVSQFTQQLQAIANDARYRSFTSPTDIQLLGCLKGVVTEVSSPLILFLHAGDILHESALLEVVNHFQQDSLGALLLCGDNPADHEHLTTVLEGESLVNIQAFFKENPLPSAAAFRTVTLEEILHQDFSTNDAIALRELYLVTQYKAWSMKPVFHILQSTGDLEHSSYDQGTELLQAILIDFLASVRENDPFADERRSTGLIIEFDEETVSAARDYLAR